MDRRKRLAFTLAGVGFGAVAVAAAQGTKPKAKPAGFHLVRTHPIADAQIPSGLAVDGAAGRIYVARSVDVLVMDTATGKEAATIPCPESRQGIALAPELKLGFASHSATGSLTGFDLASGSAIFDAKTGETPTQPSFDASLKRVATVDQKGCDVTVIDATNGNVVGSVPLGAPPGEAAGDGKGRLYVADPQKNEVIAVDLKKLEIAKRWSIAPLRLGHGIAVDPSTRRLFLGTDDEQLAVTSVESWKTVTTVVLRREVHACVFDPGTQTILATTGDRSLSVVHEDSADKYTVVEHAVTEDDVKLLALDGKTHEVALVAWKLGPKEQRGEIYVQPIVEGSLKILIYGK